MNHEQALNAIMQATIEIESNRRILINNILYQYERDLQDSVYIVGCASVAEMAKKGFERGTGL